MFLLITTNIPVDVSMLVILLALILLIIAVGLNQYFNTQRLLREKERIISQLETDKSITEKLVAQSFFHLDIARTKVLPEASNVKSKNEIGTLSKREMQVLELISTEGLKARQVAERLNISKHTVNNHIASIYAKTGCNSKSQLLVFVHKNGLFE